MIYYTFNPTLFKKAYDMAVVVQCDNCGRIQNGKQSKYIGRNFVFKNYKYGVPEPQILISASEDYCSDCIQDIFKNIFNTGSLETL